MLVSCVCGRERMLVKLSRCGIAIFLDFAPALHLSGLFHQRYFSVDPVGTNMYSNKIMNTAV